MKKEEFIESVIAEQLGELREAKKVFQSEYGSKSAFFDFRWQTHLEGLFIDQLDRLSFRLSKETFCEEFRSELVGEYVFAFFNATDNGEF